MKKHKWTDQEIAEFRKTHESSLYFNRLDVNMFVPKAVGRGYAMNWANPWSLLIYAVLVAACVYMFIIIK